MVVFTLAAELALGIRPLIVPDGWQFLSMSINAFSAACLSLLICKLPPTLSVITLALLTGSYFTGSALGGTIKPEGVIQHVPVAETELTLNYLGQVLYPFIDVETLLKTTTPSMVPIASYVSNVLLYLLGATWLLNRREFSYAEE
jgi:hypothetical protein